MITSLLMMVIEILILEEPLEDYFGTNEKGGFTYIKVKD